MTIYENTTDSKLAHYRAWTRAWLAIEQSPLPAEECLAIVEEEGPSWLNQQSRTTESIDNTHKLVSCFKTAAKARLVLLGGSIPPSHDECDVLSESYDARVTCTCSGVFPVSSDFDASNLKSCGCVSIERMIDRGNLVNSRENEWNSSDFFSAQGLSSAMEELALCHADMQPSPASCHSEQGKPDWPEVRAPDRKPDPEVDLDEETYTSLYPTRERIRLSADAKHFHAFASGASLVDIGILTAITDSGNDILIGDYCEAASEDSLKALQQSGAAAFAFLKVCVYAGLMTRWQFDQLVAQTIQFRIMGYWRDHALPRLPQGVYGSRMTGLLVHRHVDLGMTVGIVSASIATGQTMSGAEYTDLVTTLTLFNDLIDFRGDTWRKQRENVVLRGVRGQLCAYLDDLLTKSIRGAAALIRRGNIFELNVMCFCNWLLLGSGHKVYEIMRGTSAVGVNQPCRYESQSNGAYEELLGSLACYEPLGEGGPGIDMKRKDLQLLYASRRQAPEDHIRWLADVVRVVLHPDNLRRLVDVVHHPWQGELGDVEYCA